MINQSKNIKSLIINQEIAAVFRLKADKLNMTDKNKYRVISLRKAASALENLDRGVDEIYKHTWLPGLEKIEGIGNRLAHAIEAELRKRGIRK
ncbi:MAG: helix-hairpin-helix domain-containing protein [Patescibacteria group bacterium]